MRNITYIIVLLLLIAFSCNHDNKYIIETNIRTFFPDTIKSLTVAESNRISSEFTDKAYINTVGKRVPPTYIFNDSGDSLELTSLFENKTIIISCDSYCAFGLDGIMNDFPNAINVIDPNHEIYKIICLLRQTNMDIKEPAKFNKVYAELLQYYDKVYIIQERDALRINLFGGPGRLYINEDNIVTNIGFGLSMIDGHLEKEIENSDVYYSTYLEKLEKTYGINTEKSATSR